MSEKTTAVNAELDRRYDFVLLFDVTNGNPNGDPDAGNTPRTDPETGHGLVSDVCLKRKIRNFVTLVKRDAKSGQFAAGYDIYVKEKGVLNQLHQGAHDAVGLKPDAKGAEKAGKISKARAWMCQTYYDIRTFGAVMSTEINCGQVRGPVQFAFARSTDPIQNLSQSITRMAVTNERDLEKERTMGRKEIVPYALYVAHGFVSPYLAADTGFSKADLALLWEALKMMFEHDRSAARGEMTACKLVVFEHESMLGNAPAHTLFERLSIKRKDETRPARAFSDYAVTLDETKLPTGIKVLNLL